MSTNYPGALDNTSDLINNATDATVSATTHATAHNNVADSIIAIETALGTNPAGSYSSVAAFLLNCLVKSPSTGQVIQPTADVVPITVKKGNSLYVSNLYQWALQDGTVVAFVDKSGNFSAQGLKINGAALSSQNLSDVAHLLINNPGAVQIIQMTVDNLCPIIIKRFASDTTSHLQRWDDETGVVLAAVHSGGQIDSVVGFSVNGVLLNASSLTNGVTGSGEIVLQTSPTIDTPIIVSPTISNAALTGTPTAPTPTAGDNSTKVATTAFVETAVGSGVTRYAKTTSEAINNIVSAQDLLNGEITIAANKLLGSKLLVARLTGDWLQDTGSTECAPGFQLVVGGTTIFAIPQLTSAVINSGTTRMGWKATIECLGLSSSSQMWSIQMIVTAAPTYNVAQSLLFTTGEGSVYVGSNEPLVASGSEESSLDMTTSQTFVFNVLNRVASVNYETKLFGASVDIS